jgi:hypothetical protein
MPYLCKICTSDRRESIDRSILAGTSLRTIASTFNISRMAVQRHGANHVHAADVRAEVAKARKQVLTEVAASTPAGPVQIASASDVLDELRWTYGETKQLYEIAKASSDTRLMDKAIGQVGAFLEKFSRCFGMYQDGVTVNIDARQTKLIAMYDALPEGVLLALDRGETTIEQVLESAS